MNKKKGSAMVLAILLLAFFMALSLNMWFISQKKAQRAGDKVLGNKVLTDIDGSSTLGYYEFYLATEYMNKGFVTSPAAYTVTTSSISYFDDVTAVRSTTIEGISLENEKQYFASFLSPSGIYTTTANALLNSEVIVASNLQTRQWTTPIDITEIWENVDRTSFGGYRLTSLNIKLKSQPVSSYAPIKPIIDGLSPKSLTMYFQGRPDGDYTLQSTYSKTINLSSNPIYNKDTSYIITVMRTSEIIKTGSTYSKPVSDDINEIVVTKQ